MEFNNLTHVIEAFAWPDTNGSLSFFPDVPNQALIQAVHAANKKILLSFGGESSSNGFAVLTADSIHRKNFINNVVTILTVNHYDGIDIDWEYPANLQQSGQLTTLIKELRQKFDSINTPLLITMAAPASSFYGQIYQYEIMANYIDWFSIMTYSYHGAWSNHSGHNAPLYPTMQDNDGSVAASVGYMYFTRKVPQNKLLLGIPFYGMEFNAAGLYKSYTGSVSDLNYSDAIDSLHKGGWNYTWDSVCAVPYLQNNTHTGLITFEDTMSVRLKTEYSFSKNLGGVMIWALDQDMIDNFQPLLESIGKTVRNHQSTEVNDEKLSGPCTFNLYNNYPNPFNPSTIIKFSLSESSLVKLIIYDVLGREIEILVDNSLPAGFHSVNFNASNFPSGIYFYVLRIGTDSMCKKMILIK
jgi:chitinase